MRKNNFRCARLAACIALAAGCGGGANETGSGSDAVNASTAFVMGNYTVSEIDGSGNVLHDVAVRQDFDINYLLDPFSFVRDGRIAWVVSGHFSDVHRTLYQLDLDAEAVTATFELPAGEDASQVLVTPDTVWLVTVSSAAGRLTLRKLSRDSLTVEGTYTRDVESGSEVRANADSVDILASDTLTRVDAASLTETATLKLAGPVQDPGLVVVGDEYWIAVDERQGPTRFEKVSISSLQVLSKAPSTPWPPQPSPYGFRPVLVNDEALFIADPEGQCFVRIDRGTGAQHRRFVCIDDGEDPVNVHMRFSAVHGNTLWVITNTFGESKVFDATTGDVLATNHAIEVDAIAL